MATADPFSPEVLDDPYATWAAWRETSGVDPVEGHGIYLVLRHDLVSEALARTDDFSNHLTAFFLRGDDGSLVLLDASGAGAQVLATADDPEHAVHRRSLQRPFAERRMADIEPELRAMVAAMIDAHVRTGRIEWVDGVSGALPIRAIVLLLGLPEADADRLKFWSDEGIEVLSGFATATRLAECTANIATFEAYLRDALDRARAAHRRGEAPPVVLSTIAAAVEAGDYDETTAVGMLLQLVGAGSDSTTGLTGSCALALATHPEVQRALRADPARIPAFVEEVLRLETPFRGHFRHVRRACSLGGVGLREGDRLLLLWGAANRDPAAFDRPDELRLDRNGRVPHLGFGWGIHHCIGAPLARLEARLSVEELLARTRLVALDDEAPGPTWVRSLFLRRLAELHLRVEPA